MKKTLLILSLLVAVCCVSAQDDYGKFAYGFGYATGGDANNLSFAVGLPFYSQPENPGSYSVSEGVMQAQLITTNYQLAGCQNAENVSPAHVKDTSGFFLDYPGEDIVFHGSTINVFPAGIYDSTSYDAGHYNWNAQYNYDSLTTLVLEVWPIYEMFDTLYLDSTDIVTDYATNVLHVPGNPSDPWHMLHGGPNEYVLGTVEHDCDSIRHFFVYLCGGTVKDADGNEYPSLFVGTAPQRYCWTQKNMKTTHYNDGGEVPNMIYSGDGHNDEAFNLETYGRLYTWYAAVNLPTGSTSNPPETTNGGFVTGICPVGWHIPDSLNMVSLQDINAFNLMSDSELWIERGPSSEMNTTGFSALPAGWYNPVTHRFEDMQGLTYFWSSVRHGFSECWVCSLAFGCNKVINEDLTLEGGVSVRCVKNQMYAMDGTELND